MYCKKLHQSLSGKKSGKTDDDDWELLDWHVLCVIWLNLTNNMTPNVAKAKTTKEIMSILSDIYEKSSANKVQLMKKFFNLKRGECTSVAKHVNQFNTIVSQLTLVEINFDDEICALILWNLYQIIGEISNFVGKIK